MAYALLDILTGEYKQPEFNSITTHLKRLLNSRQGSLPHMPDYGLPEITEIYQGLPYSINDLIAAIKNAIKKYEPRLTNITVEPIKSIANSPTDCVLTLKISAITHDNAEVEFDTYFTSAGAIKVAL